MLPRNNQRPFILSALTLCMSGAAFAATSPNTLLRLDEDTVIVTANRTESSLWDSPATIRLSIARRCKTPPAFLLLMIYKIFPASKSPITPSQAETNSYPWRSVFAGADFDRRPVVSYQRAGQNYGAGLLIDESALERIEVVKGPILSSTVRRRLAVS